MHALCLTKKGDSLSIFQMQPKYLNQCKEEVDKVLAAAATTINANARLVNPFDAVISNEADVVFLKLAKNCQFFIQNTPNGEVFPCEQMLATKGFKGRVAITIKGVRLNKEKKLLAPMIVVQQILNLPYFTIPATVNDGKCILAVDDDDDDDDEEAKRD